MNSFISVLPLTVLLYNVDYPTIPEQVQGALSSDQDKLNATAENKSGQWKSTASAMARLFLRGVKDSSDAFPPLKSVTGCLCFLLENCEVWQPRVQYPLSAMLMGTPANKGK